MVGASRFERPTSRTPSECANQAALRSDTPLRCQRSVDSTVIYPIIIEFQEKKSSISRILTLI